MGCHTSAAAGQGATGAGAQGSRRRPETVRQTTSGSDLGSKINFNFVANQLRRCQNSMDRCESELPELLELPGLPACLTACLLEVGTWFIGIVLAVAFTQRFHVKGDDLMRQSRAERRDKRIAASRSGDTLGA